MVWKKIAQVLFALVFISVMILVGFYGWKVFYQYQQTAVWKNTKLEGTLNNIPPELTKNYITADQIDDLEIWTKLEEELQTIQKQKMIPLEKVEGLENIYQQAMISKEKQHIKQGEIATQIELLRIYLDITIFASEAYKNPEPSKLSTLYHQMEYITLENNTELNRAYLGQLTTIAKDYTSLKSFIDTTLPLLGEVSEHKVLVNRKLTSLDTKSMLEQIQATDLTKFPNIKELNMLLMSGEWLDAVTLNEKANQYEQWQMQKQMMQALTQKDYIDITTITTYQEALDAGIQVDVLEHESYEIAMDSPVNDIRYNGKKLIPGEYVLKGTPLIVTIRPIYKAKPLETSETRNTTVERTTIETTETTETTDTTDTSNTTSTTSSADE